MPCHLCAERSEDYPFPAIFKTPFMATAFPDFKAETDFLCPKCYSVYFRIIECKYGPRASRRPPSSQGSTNSENTPTTSPRWRSGNLAAAPASTSGSWRPNSLSDFALSGINLRPNSLAGTAPAGTHWRPNSLSDIPTTSSRWRPNNAADIIASINRWRFPAPAAPDHMEDMEDEENASKRMRETI